VLLVAKSVAYAIDAGFTENSQGVEIHGGPRPLLAILLATCFHLSPNRHEASLI